MSSPQPPPHDCDLTDEQKAGVACAGCCRSDRALYDTMPVVVRGGAIPIQVFPVKRCWDCLPDSRRMIVLASSDEAAS